MKSELIKFGEQVLQAVETERPVVALESTVIAHGLPRPLNLEVANRLETIVSEEGAVPATIAVLNGHFYVGLSEAEKKLIARQDGIKKVSVRDLPIAVAARWNGATTVATTLWIAHRAGLKVLATGGIGGVHRGQLPDVSADLPQLASTPMVVVCSGAKIVLDLPATREWLETHGVTVLGYLCDELPAFYSRSSGLPVDARVDSAAGVARIFDAQQELGTQSALLVSAPVPEEAEVRPASLLDRLLDDALMKAERLEVSGRELTPFLLSEMTLNSEGATVRANIALLENNARIAAQIAMALGRG